MSLISKIKLLKQCPKNKAGDLSLGELKIVVFRVFEKLILILMDWKL